MNGTSATNIYVKSLNWHNGYLSSLKTSLGSHYFISSPKGMTHLVRMQNIPNN